MDNLITDEMVEAGAKAIQRAKWEAVRLHMEGKSPTMYAKHNTEARACLEAALSLPPKPTDPV